MLGTLLDGKHAKEAQKNRNHVLVRLNAFSLKNTKPALATGTEDTWTKVIWAGKLLETHKVTQTSVKRSRKRTKLWKNIQSRFAGCSSSLRVVRSSSSFSESLLIAAQQGSFACSAPNSTGGATSYCRGGFPSFLRVLLMKFVQNTRFWTNSKGGSTWQITVFSTRLGSK